jgi:hypothetical protein
MYSSTVAASSAETGIKSGCSADLCAAGSLQRLPLPPVIRLRQGVQNAAK